MTPSTENPLSQPQHLLVGVVVAALAGAVWKMEKAEGVDCYLGLFGGVMLSALMAPLLAKTTSSIDPCHGAPQEEGCGQGGELESTSSCDNCSEQSVDEEIDCDAARQSVAASPYDAFTDAERDQQIAKYINGSIVYADGSPAHVPAGESPNMIPPNFLQFCNGNQTQAKKKWLNHQKWRKERELWSIHTKPDPCFDAIKQAYPHVCHGRSKQGWVVMYEHPGRMNMQQMFHAEVKSDDILHHDIFILESCANVLHYPREDSSTWGMIGVLDLTDLKSSEFLSREVFHYLSMISQVNDAHYPLHVKKVFMIHAPFWLASAFKIIKPILPPSVVIEILSSDDYMEVLREYIDDHELPQEFGGSSPWKLGQHPMELELADLARKGAGANNGSETEKEIDETAVTSPNSTNSIENGSSANLEQRTASQPGESELKTIIRQWPLPLMHLPSICSTSFTASYEEEEKDDNDVSFDTASQRSGFLGKGPLRPRLPSFEPVLSAAEEERVIATFYSSANEGADKKGAYPSRQGEHEPHESVACGEIVWTTLLAACS